MHFMSMFWNIKGLFIALVMIISTSCSVHKYTVYDRAFSKVKIDLNKPDQAVILINNSYCAPCLPTLRDSLDTVYNSTILVCLIDKSKASATLKMLELESSNLKFDKVYFQFHKKSDAYKSRITNRLYRKYDSVAAPFALINIDGKIVKVF